MKYLIKFAILLFFGPLLSAQVGDPQNCLIVDPYNINVTESGPTDPNVETSQPHSEEVDRNHTDRLIYWVHGLGGGVNSWSTAAKESNSRWQIMSAFPTYTETTIGNGISNFPDGYIEGAGLDLHQKLVDLNSNPQEPMNNFIIAHSQGGLVSRTTDAYYINEHFPDQQRTFGGLVTFGTAHQGAKIVNNFGMIENFKSHTCNNLVPALAQYISDDNILPPGFDAILDFISNYVSDDGYDSLLGALCDLLYDLFDNVTEDFIKPTAQEFAVGTPTMNALNNIPSVIPKVAFHGVEEEAIFWRFIYSMVHNPNNSPAFQADYDSEYYELANSMSQLFKIRYLLYNFLYEYTKNNYFQYENPIIQYYYLNLYSKRRDRYYKGYQWFLDANDSWKTIIGARENKEISYGYNCQCTRTQADGSVEVMHEITVDDPADCTSPNSLVECIATEKIDVIETNYPSDGLVLVSSQSNFPGADFGTDNAMIGSNHSQMRNDSQTEQKLTELFDGQHGLYFYTDER